MKIDGGRQPDRKYMKIIKEDQSLQKYDPLLDRDKANERRGQDQREIGGYVILQKN
jgi:hypothetical protein